MAHFWFNQSTEPLPTNGLKIKIRSWYPVWFTKWLIARSIRRELKRYVGRRNTKYTRKLIVKTLRKMGFK